VGKPILYRPGGWRHSTTLRRRCWRPNTQELQLTKLDGSTGRSMLRRASRNPLLLATLVLLHPSAPVHGSDVDEDYSNVFAEDMSAGAWLPREQVARRLASSFVSSLTPVGVRPGGGCVIRLPCQRQHESSPRPHALRARPAQAPARTHAVPRRSPSSSRRRLLRLQLGVHPAPAHPVPDARRQPHHARVA
jgi:hypothetical protein